MGLFVGGTPVKSVYVGSTPVTAVYVGAEKVWPTIREVVQFTLGTNTDVRDQFRAAMSDRGLDYRRVTEIPFDIELVGSGGVQHMFNGCSALTTVPDLDTSNVTNMLSMFRNCSSLTTAPDLDTSSVTGMGYMFYGCSALTTAPDLDTSSVTDMSYMFYGCSALVSVPDMNTSSVTYMNAMFRNCSALTDGNVRLIGRRPNVATTNMITGSGLTREPWYKADGTIERIVSIQAHYSTPNNVWTSGTQSVDTDLITYFSESYIRLSEDVTCNRPVTAGMQTVSPGTVIAAGSNIYPNDWGVTFTFTTT